MYELENKYTKLYAQNTNICKKTQNTIYVHKKYIQNKIKHKPVGLFQQKPDAYCLVCNCGIFSYHNNEMMSF